MMEAASTYETLVNFYQTTQCNNPEDSYLQKAPHESEVNTMIGKALCCPFTPNFGIIYIF
jgi:hypothetical protein